MSCQGAGGVRAGLPSENYVSGATTEPVSSGTLDGCAESASLDKSSSHFLVSALPSGYASVHRQNSECDMSDHVAGGQEQEQRPVGV